MWGQLVHLLARLMIGVLFVWAGVPKLIYPEVLFNAVMDYGFFNAAVAQLAAWLLPALEIILGISLIIGVKIRGAFAMATLLLAGFAILHTVVFFQGIDVTCGCFGIAGAEKITGLTVARNLILTLVASIGWIVSRRIEHQVVPKDIGVVNESVVHPQEQPVVPT